MTHLSPAEIETIRVPEPKHDPFTLESLVAWLERQDGAQAYEYHDVSGRCLLSQYLTASGLDWGLDYPKLMNLGLRVDIANAKPYTFGAALQRARAALTRARAALSSQKGNANG